MNLLRPSCRGLWGLGILSGSWAWFFGHDKQTLAIVTQIAKTIGSASIRHRSDTFAWDRHQPRVFAIWVKWLKTVTITCPWPAKRNHFLAWLQWRQMGGLSNHRQLDYLFGSVCSGYQQQKRKSPSISPMGIHLWIPPHRTRNAKIISMACRRHYMNHTFNWWLILSYALIFRHTVINKCSLLRSRAFSVLGNIWKWIKMHVSLNNSIHVVLSSHHAYIRRGDMCWYVIRTTPSLYKFWILACGVSKYSVSRWNIWQHCLAGGGF